MTSREKLTHNLNPSQKKAVETLDGPVLILAGAGSGKTRVLTHRMANMIASGVATSEEILCVTFTNKAAKEMEHRIFKLLSDLNIPVTRDMWVSTFHAFCVRILRSHVDMLDYKKPFTIYDSGDQLALIKRCMNTLNINDKLFPPKGIQSKISHAKMLGQTPDQFKSTNRQQKTFGSMDPKSIEVYSKYEEEMKKANALDFDDLLLKTYELFRMYPGLLEQYQSKFRYIMIDEYQDTNHIQYLLVQMLAKAHRNLCVVGDEDQSIYSWRGADISNILDFEKDFPEATIIKLEENYRSSGNIVKAATQLISNNTQRKEKTLFTNNPVGAKIQIREERNEYDEARFVSKTIQGLISSGESNLNNYSIFYRTNAQSRVLEEQLRALAIPYKLIGGIRFYERAEVKDVIAYLRLAVNYKDDMALKRIINVPARGLGKTTVETLEEQANHLNLSLFETIHNAIEERVFNSGTVSKLRRFYELIHELITLQSNYRISEFLSLVLEKTEYVAALKKEDTPEAEARLENLDELDNAIAQFEKERGDEASLSNYLEELTLSSDQDQVDGQINAVTMMTMHISKGLEYPYVFIVGCEENLFPSVRGEEENKDDLEEERRLAYVGMTRAREKLWLTHTKIRRVWGQEQMNPPSRFLKEIPKEFTEFSSAVFSAQTPRFVTKNSNFNSESSRFTGQSFSDDYSQPSYDDDYTQTSNPNQVGKSSGFTKGQKVRHPTFGAGSIFATEGTGDNLKISVLFQDNTIKKFVAKYARLEKV